MLVKVSSDSLLFADLVPQVQFQSTDAAVREVLTLTEDADDLDDFVGGAFAPRPLPAATTVDEAGGYRAALSTEGLTAGAPAELTFDLSRDGRPLTGVEPYLGADGHLVALREGDLAFLHVHPEASDDPSRIRFGAELPTPGRYRLFLQFRHDGAVRTVAFTLEVSP